MAKQGFVLDEWLDSHGLQWSAETIQSCLDHPKVDIADNSPVVACHFGEWASVKSDSIVIEIELGIESEIAHQAAKGVPHPGGRVSGPRPVGRGHGLHPALTRCDGCCGRIRCRPKPFGQNGCQRLIGLTVNGVRCRLRMIRIVGGGCAIQGLGPPRSARFFADASCESDLNQLVEMDPSRIEVKPHFVCGLSHVECVIGTSKKFQKLCPLRDTQHSMGTES